MPPARDDGGEEETTESLYSLPSDSQLAQRLIAENKPNMRRYVKGISNTDFSKYLTISVDEEEYEVEDFELCDVCNKPLLFFHDLSRSATRCNADMIPVETIENFVFPNMLKDHFVNAKIKSVLSEVKIRDGIAKAQAIAKATPAAQQARQQPPVDNRKILDAPKWSEKQDLESFLEALNSWAMLHDFANGLQILYALCVSLESAERHDIANELRQFFPAADARAKDSVSFIAGVIKHIRMKFARSKRDEMETAWLKLLSASHEGDVMKTISEFELQTKRLQNLGAKIDENLLSIQLMLNCKLSKSEKQHAVSAIGDIDQADIYDKTKRILKLLRSDASSRANNDPLISYYGLNYSNRKRSASWSDRPRTPQRTPKENTNKSPFKNRQNNYNADNRNFRPRTPSRERRERRPSFNNNNFNRNSRQDTFAAETQEGQNDPLEDTENCFYTSAIDLICLADKFGCELFGILDTGCPRSVMSRSKAKDIVQSANPGFYKVSNANANFRFGSTRVLEARKSIQLNLKFMDIERRVQFFIVDANIPILLGKDIIQHNFGAILDSTSNVLKIKGKDNRYREIKLLELGSRHWGLELSLTSLYNKQTGKLKVNHPFLTDDVTKEGDPPDEGAGAGAVPRLRRGGDDGVQRGRLQHPAVQPGGSQEHLTTPRGTREGRPGQQDGLQARQVHLGPDQRDQLRQQGPRDQAVPDQQGNGKNPQNNISQQSFFSYAELKKLHHNLGHRSVDSMVQNLKQTTRFKPENRQMLLNIQKKCKACKMNAKATPKPKVGWPKSSDFNECVSIDLKDKMSQFNKYILYATEEFSGLIKGRVIPNKKAEIVVQAFFDMWIIGDGFGPGIPARIFSDNGAEFDNDTFSEFTSKLGMRVQRSAAYSPWQNGKCERIHGAVDLLVDKILDNDPAMSLQQAVDLACFNKNSEVSRRTGFSPFQIVLGKNPSFISNFDFDPVTAETNFKSTLVLNLITRLNDVRRQFRSIDLDDRVKRALSQRVYNYSRTPLRGGAIRFCLRTSTICLSEAR